MKTREEVLQELSKNSITKGITQFNHPAVDSVLSFYEKYPQYQELEAAGVHFVLMALKKNTVKVYRYTNGDLLFVGDIITSKNAPISGIGDGMRTPVNFDWNNIEASSGGILTLDAIIQ